MSKVDDSEIKKILTVDPIEFGLYMTVYSRWSEMNWRRFVAALFQDAYKVRNMVVSIPPYRENMHRALNWLQLGEGSTLYKQIVEDLDKKVSLILPGKIDEFRNYVLANSRISIVDADAYVGQYFDAMYYGVTYQFENYLSTLNNDPAKAVISDFSLHYDAEGKPVAKSISHNECIPNFFTGESQFDFIDYYVQNLQGEKTGYKLSDIKIGIPSVGKLLTEVEPSKLIMENGKAYLEVGSIGNEDNSITVEFTSLTEPTNLDAAMRLAEKMLASKKLNDGGVNVKLDDIYKVLFESNRKACLEIVTPVNVDRILANTFNILLHNNGETDKQLGEHFLLRWPEESYQFIEIIPILREQLSSLMVELNAAAFPFDPKTWLSGYFSQLELPDAFNRIHTNYPSLATWFAQQISGAK